MTTYKMIEENNLFSVEETKTSSKDKLIVYASNIKENAMVVYRNMKHGGAFNGWTPNFLTPSKELVKIV